MTINASAKDSTSHPFREGWDGGFYGIGGGEGKGGTEGKGGVGASTGGTDASGLNSPRTASVAEFSADVAPDLTESGKADVSGPLWRRAGRGLRGTTPELRLVAAGAAEAEAACGVGLDAFIETTISGTATTAATRWAAVSVPAAARCLPSWKMPKTTATREAALTARCLARCRTWAAAM